MLYLEDPGLDAKTARGLNRYQAKVDSGRTYAERVERGKALFESYNRRENRVFGAVRERLATMCAGARRCGYCEDSVGDEVEHIRPKDIYPEAVFVWENYLLACGPCNRGKNNRFSVIRGGRLIDVTGGGNDPVRRPQSGSPAPINPRREDPLVFLDLELVDTFRFLPRDDLSAVDELRACFTIKMLNLNRDVLIEARRHAYGSFRALLREYRVLRDEGASVATLETLRDAIKDSPHPTVWREIQRQQPVIDELRALFQEVPEALDW